MAMMQYMLLLSHRTEQQASSSRSQKHAEHVCRPDPVRWSRDTLTTTL